MPPVLLSVIAAAGAGEIETVSALIDRDPSLATASTMLGAQPIHAAHFAGHRDVVELLLNRGVALDGFLAADLGIIERLDLRSPNAVDPNGSTALHRASYWGQLEAARALLYQGADPNAVTQDSFLQIHPLGCAVATPDVPNPSDHEDTVLALVRLLLERGAEVSARRRDGLTALHSAAWRGHVKVIAYLLDQGADPGIQGYEGAGPHAGQTALDVALSQGQGEPVTSLLRNVINNLRIS